MKRTHSHSITLPLLLLCTTLALSSCEKEIEIEHKYDNGIAVFALAVPGQKFSVRVSRSFTVNTNPQFTFQPAHYYQDLDSIYQAEALIDNADVNIIVNGTDTYHLDYSNEKPFDYRCEYVPKLGDQISLTVKAQGYPDATASATIEPQPSTIQVIDTTVLFDKEAFDPMVDPTTSTGESFNTDTVMDITFRLHDPGTGRRFYKLVVRGMATDSVHIGVMRVPYFSLLDVFYSDDILFQDPQLSKPYGLWPARFSNIFDNHLFQGKDYTVTVRTRKRRGHDPKVWVELETLSPDLYYFQKSYQIYRISTDDVYTTPVGIYSNINNGYGIFGAVSRDTLSIHY